MSPSTLSGNSSSYTAKAIEYMIIDALLAAEPYMQIAHQIYDPKRYVYLTDDIKTRIEATTQPVIRTSLCCREV